METVQIRSFFSSVFSYIRTEYRKIRTRKHSLFRHFSHSVNFRLFSNVLNVFTMNQSQALDDISLRLTYNLLLLFRSFKMYLQFCMVVIFQPFLIRLPDVRTLTVLNQHLKKVCANAKQVLTSSASIFWFCFQGKLNQNCMQQKQRFKMALPQLTMRRRYSNKSNLLVI